MNKEEIKKLIEEVLEGKNMIEKFKKDKKEIKEFKKQKKDISNKNHILFAYNQEKNVNLQKLNKIDITTEFVTTCIDSWDEYKIESPLINKESILILSKIIKDKFDYIKHIVYTNNYLIRLYAGEDIYNIYKNNIALHVDNGILKILVFNENEKTEGLIILNFIKDFFNESIENIEYDTDRVKKDLHYFINHPINEEE
jgi:hypothetical protein